jgi:hypothetical protein
LQRKVVYSGESETRRELQWVALEVGNGKTRKSRKGKRREEASTLGESKGKRWVLKMGAASLENGLVPCREAWGNCEWRSSAGVDLMRGTVEEESTLG